MTPEVADTIRTAAVLLGLYAMCNVTIFSFLTWVFWRAVRHDKDTPADRR